MPIHRALVLVTVLAAVACSPQPEQEAPTPVYNPQLDVRLESVPEGFEVVANAGDRLELAPVAAGEESPVPGRVWFQTGPEEEGVNLVAAVQQHQRFVEEQPDGEYLGAREFQGPLGAVFSSRGRFEEGDGTIEETVLYALHPTQSRRLEIHYRYPAGDDSGDRVTSLIDVLASIAVPDESGGDQ